MVRFVDFGEPADIFRPSLKTIFNGFNLDDELTDDTGSFITLSVSGRNDSEYDITTHEIAGLTGVIEEGNPTMKSRVITVRFRIKDETSTGLQRKFEKLRSLLEGSKKELTFTDDEFFFYATNQTLSVPDETSNSLTSTITFLCSDPYKYGPEKVLGFPSDLVTVSNEGTAETFPVYEMTVLTPITFAMVQNQLQETLLIGKPTDDDIQAVDYRTSRLYENGSTLSSWQHTQNRTLISNDRNIDSLDGVMGTEGIGLRPIDYGTSKSGQRGPAITKELSNAIQDFEVESTFDIISNFEAENFRMMIYFLDENMSSIGHIGLKDNSINFKRRVALAQLGEHQEGETLIGDNDRIVDDSRDNTVYYLRFKREGIRFTAYIAYVRNLKHQIVWQRSYTDFNNQFQGKLKHITVFVGSFQDRGVPSRLRVNSVEVSELKTIEEDQTPYIAYPGDIITFDTQTEEILINGEDAMIHKDFVSKFFSLKKGENTLGILPENALDVQMRYKERRK